MEGVSPLFELQMPSPQDVAAEQEAVVPPLLPMHDHVHGPGPVAGRTSEEVPESHNPDVGFTPVETPLAEPHTPFMGGGTDDVTVREGQLADHELWLS